MVPLGNQVTEQLHQLGIAPELLQARLGELQRAPLNALSTLSAAYAQAAWAPGSDKFSTDVSDGRVGLAPAWSNSTPAEALKARSRLLFKTYHRELAPRHPAAGDLSALATRRRTGALMVRRLHRDPVLRQAVERATALKIVRDGRMDGAVSVAPMTMGRSVTPMAPGGVSGNLFSFLGAMDTAIIEQAKKLGVYSSSNPEVFFGEGRDLDLFGKGSQYGVSSPSTTGVFGMAGGQAAPPTGDQSQGLDTRVMQLKRMMDKRNQMYDIVRTIFDKYNESARTSIGNMKA